MPGTAQHAHAEDLSPVSPIHTAHLFADLHTDLVGLLRSLSPDDWRAPTVCSGWTVHDVAAHLLGGDLSKVSGLRDRHSSPPPPYPLDDPDALLRFVNQNNATFVHAMRRASPRILTAWIDEIGREIPALFAALDPDAPSHVAVSWAGDTVSPNWFDTAREFTERWHHQQHIRDAVGRPDLNPRYLAPALDTFLRALPHCYRAVTSDAGATLAITLTGPGGGDWVLRYVDATWRLYRGFTTTPTATVSTDSDTAWRLFTKGLPLESARARVRMAGNATLSEPFLHVVSIVG